jgi:PAS domain S-box-containing protein/putative nucleotidyltransferase with HDIG domain
MADNERTKEELLEEIDRLRSELNSLRYLENINSDEALWMSNRIVENIPIGITIQDLGGKIIFANTAAEKLLSLTRIHITQRLYHPVTWKLTTTDGKTLPDEDQPYVRIIKNGESYYHLDCAIEYPDKKTIMLSLRAVPFHDAEGNLVGIINSFSDITELKNSEETLELTQFSVDNSAIPTYWTDPHGKFLHVNKAACEELEYSSQEMLKMSVMDIDPNITSKKWLECWKDLKKSGSKTFESIHKTKSGRIYPVIANVNYFEFDGKEYNFSFVMDITMQKAALEASQANEERFRDLFDSMSSGVAVYDAKDNGKDFIIRDFNKAGEKIEKVKKEDIIGKSVLEVFPGVKKFGLFDVFTRVWLTGKPEKHPLSLYKDGKISSWRENYVYKLSSGEIVAVYDDVTERQLSIEETTRNAKMLRAVLDSSLDAIYLMDPSGELLDMNEPGAKMLGKSIAALKGANAFELFPAELKQSRQSRIDEVVRTGKPSHFEDGSLGCIVENSIYPIISTRKDVEKLAVFVRDITDRKQMEKSLKDSEALYHTLADVSPDMIYLIDKTGLIRYANPAAARQLHATADKIIGRHIKDVFSMPLAQRHLEGIKNVLATGKTISQEILGQFPKSIEWIDATLTPVKNTTDNAAAVLGISRIITDRKEYEKQLVEREKKYRSIFESFYDIYFMIDLSGSIKEISPSVSARLGYDVKGLIGRSIFDFTDEARAKQFFKQLKKLGAIADYETVFTEKTGKKIDASVNAHTVTDEDGKAVGIEGVIRDITARKKSEESLQFAYNNLKKSIEGIVKALATTSELKDSYTAGHQKRVSVLACAIAKEIGMTADQVECLKIAGLLHDIGKISIPSSILMKEGLLTPADFNIIRTHPKMGYEILKNIDFPWPIAPIVLYHHERLNGTGYPAGLKDNEISLETKIISVADVVEAIAFKRPYRDALGLGKALEEIDHKSGILYDSKVVAACLKVFKEGDFEF